MHGLVATATDHRDGAGWRAEAATAGLRPVVTRWHRVNEGEHVFSDHAGRSSRRGAFRGASHASRTSSD